MPPDHSQLAATTAEALHIQPSYGPKDGKVTKLRLMSTLQMAIEPLVWVQSTYVLLFGPTVIAIGV